VERREQITFHLNCFLQSHFNNFKHFERVREKNNNVREPTESKPAIVSGTGPPKNVVAIGCTGTGKSATLKTLLGLVDNGNNAIDPTRHFRDSSGMNAAGTKLTQSIMGPTKTFDPGQQGSMIRAFDTPGLGALLEMRKTV